MRKLKINLAIFAALLGTGAAFATTSVKPIPGYYYDQTSMSWQINTRSPGTLSGQYQCQSDPLQPCTATGFDTHGNPTGVVKGDYTVNP